jgi:hypothetical protein
MGPRMTENPFFLPDEFASIPAGLAALARYSPKSLEAPHWEIWREDVLALAGRACPENANTARGLAGLLCGLIALVEPAAGTPLANILTDTNITVAVNAGRRRGGAARVAYMSRLRFLRLQAISRGLPSETEAVGRPKRTTKSGMATLREAAASGEGSVADIAAVLLDDLTRLRPEPWTKPLDSSTSARFRRLLSASGRGDGRIHWDRLKAECINQELHVARPTIGLLVDLRLTWHRLNGMLAASTLAVPPATGAVLRGHVTVPLSESWVIGGQSVSAAKSTRTSAARPRPSAARARRFAEAARQARESGPDPLASDLEAILAEWSPRSMPSDEWQLVRALTHEVMRRSHIKGPESFKKHLRETADNADSVRGVA